MLKNKLVAILCLCFLIVGCSNESSNSPQNESSTNTQNESSSPAQNEENSLTIDEAQQLLAKNYSVTLEEIKVVEYGNKGGTYNISYQIKKNGDWEPASPGVYLALIKKAANGEYIVDAPKY